MKKMFYLPRELEADFQRIGEIMKLMKEPGVTDIYGVAQPSPVFQRMIVNEKERFQNMPSPIEGKSMWEYVEEASMLKV